MAALTYNIVLCGFMGCGKTTVGKKLSKRLGVPFVDMDHYIEQKAGRKVSEIFAQLGEQAFRDMEYECAKELSKSGGTVIATGGGALTFERNQQALRQNGRIILLNPPLSILRHRLSGDTTRPLLNRPDRDAAMKELYEKRLPIYQRASDIVVSGKGSPNAVCQEILEALGMDSPDKNPVSI